MEERLIQFPQFLASRGAEIAQLQSTLESKYLNSTKHPYQVLHKHLKRRAMSHNRYRIPSSVLKYLYQLRKQMYVPSLVEQENQQKIAKCRKHIRKNKLFVFMNRSKKIAWMETHLMQAKRMQMVDYFGTKVAYKANEKNFRAVHRFFDHGCAIFDASYYRILEGVIEDHLNVDGKTIIHPAKLDDQDFEVKNNFCVFQIIGPEALNKINQLLDQFECRIDGQKEVYFSFTDSTSRIASRTQPVYKAVKSFDDYDDSMQMRVVQFNKGQQDDMRKVWVDTPLLNLLKRFKVTNRSRYTHRRKLKKEYQSKLKSIKKQLKETYDEEVDPDDQKKAMRWLLEQQNLIEGQQQQIKNRIQTELLEQEKPIEQKIEIEMPTETLNILIIPPSKTANDQIDIGFKVVCGTGHGLRIWRYFNQLKIKPIGLRDIQQLCLESSVEFIEDPKIPVKGYNKRYQPNYLALKFPYPYASNWELYPAWSLCTISAEKSIPKKLAIIYQPTEQDFLLYEQGVKKIEQPIEHIQMTKPKNAIETLYLEKQLAQIPQDRRILGFITYGNFSLKIGKGMGQGKVTQQLSDSKIVVLFRNPTSKYYFFADCTVENLSKEFQ